MWQLFGGRRRKSDTENIAFALFTESFKKKKSTWPARCHLCTEAFLCTEYIYFFIWFVSCISFVSLTAMIPAFYIHLCVHIYMYFIYIYVYVWLAFWAAGGLGRAVSCQLLWFQPLWYDLGSLRGQESCEDGCPEYLFRTGTLITQLNQWSAQKGWEEKDFKQCLFTVQKFSFSLLSCMWSCAGMKENQQEELTPHKYLARDFKLELEFNRKITINAVNTERLV